MLNLFQDGGGGGGYASMITIPVHRERQKNGFVHKTCMETYDLELPFSNQMEFEYSKINFCSENMLNQVCTYAIALYR